MKLLNFLVLNKPKVGDVYRFKGTKESLFILVTEVKDGMVTYTTVYPNPFENEFFTKMKYYIVSNNDLGTYKHSIFTFCVLFYEKVVQWNEIIYSREDVLAEMKDTYQTGTDQP